MEEAFPKLIARMIKTLGAPELHRRTGVGVQTWRDWAKGSPPSLSQIDRAAQSLGVRPAQLLCYEALPYGFVEGLKSLRVTSDRQAEIRRIRHELRALDQRRSALEADLDRLIESNEQTPA